MQSRKFCFTKAKEITKSDEIFDFWSESNTDNSKHLEEESVFSFILLCNYLLCRRNCPHRDSMLQDPQKRHLLIEEMHEKTKCKHPLVLQTAFISPK